MLLLGSWGLPGARLLLMWRGGSFTAGGGWRGEEGVSPCVLIQMRTGAGTAGTQTYQSPDFRIYGRKRGSVRQERQPPWCPISVRSLFRVVPLF